MEAFYRNLHIVLEFASRVDFYGDREALLADLQELRLDEAQGACAMALEACHLDLLQRGFAPREILHTPLYRRLLQLDEMVQDLADSLCRKTKSQNEGRPSGLIISDERKLFPPTGRPL